VPGLTYSLTTATSRFPAAGGPAIIHGEGRIENRLPCDSPSCCSSRFHPSSCNESLIIISWSRSRPGESPFSRSCKVHLVSIDIP
jgi:hypothetical protein